MFTMYALALVLAPDPNSGPEGVTTTDAGPAQLAPPASSSTSPVSGAEAPPTSAAPPTAAGPATSPPTLTRKPPRPSLLPRGWAVDLSVGTAVPISIGAALAVEFPHRLLGQLELGGLPGGYVDLINAVVVAAGGYDSLTAGIIRQAIQRSFVLRASAGWRPFKRRGFEFRAGYTLATLGGGISAIEGIELATGKDLQAGANAADIPLRSTTHSFHLDIGWRWVIREHFLIRTSLGYLQTVGAKTSVEAEAAGPARARVLAAAETALDDYLGDLLTTYIKAPVISLHLGYRF